MAKKIFYEAEAREKVLSGAKQLYDAVKVTFGPKGQNVMIEKKSAEKIENWIREMQSKTYVKINKDWQNCEFRYAGWIK